MQTISSFFSCRCTGLSRHSAIKKYFTVILPSIIILGFIGFYTLWEIKPRYIYPAYPYLMLLFNYGMNRLVPHFLKGTEYLEDSVLLAEETLVYRE